MRYLEKWRGHTKSRHGLPPAKSSGHGLAVSWELQPSVYAERYRYGETLSTAFAESTINQVVSKRMVKKQQMRWSQKGAHPLLQVRTRVLNGELRDAFQKWYPSCDHDGEELQLAA